MVRACDGRGRVRRAAGRPADQCGGDRVRAAASARRCAIWSWRLWTVRARSCSTRTPHLFCGRPKKALYSTKKPHTNHLRFSTPHEGEFAVFSKEKRKNLQLNKSLRSAAALHMKQAPIVVLQGSRHGGGRAGRPRRHRRERAAMARHRRFRRCAGRTDRRFVRAGDAGLRGGLCRGLAARRMRRGSRAGSDCRRSRAEQVPAVYRPLVCGDRERRAPKSPQTRPIIPISRISSLCA